MKILTVLGTRPEIIRLSLIIPKLDQTCQHVLVHTGQNFDPRLSELFFQEMNIRQPDYFLGAGSRMFGAQIAQILAGCEEVFAKEKPTKLLLLGDTNSALSSLISKRMAIPVYHMEAGNRCYDDRVPEEVNRRIIDHCSDVLMPYTERSRANLLREGILSQRIYVTGNPIFEVIKKYEASISKSDVLARLGLEPKKYFLVTMHRAENVDVETRLEGLTTALERLEETYKLAVVVSTHPRTRQRMESFGLSSHNPNILFSEPFGFFDFIALERDALAVLSDSGTVQEECAIFGVPNVTIRDVTERPETIECGSNILSGAETTQVLKCVETVLAQRDTWTAPPEYMKSNVSDTVLKILMGYQRNLRNQ